MHLDEHHCRSVPSSAEFIRVYDSLQLLAEGAPEVAIVLQPNQHWEGASAASQGSICSSWPLPWWLLSGVCLGRRMASWVGWYSWCWCWCNFNLFSSWSCSSKCSGCSIAMRMWRSRRPARFQQSVSQYFLGWKQISALKYYFTSLWISLDSRSGPHDPSLG